MNHMINPADDVSIEFSVLLRNLNRRTLVEGESSKEDGTNTANWPTTEEVLNLHDPHQPKICLPMWDIVFIVSSAFSVFLDPLICYIIIIEDRMCFFWDQKLMWIFFALRTALDLFYAMDIAVFLLRIRTKRNDKLLGACRTITDDDHKTVPNLKELLPILPRIFVALPVLQAIIIIAKYTLFESTTKLFSFIPIQYTLRAYYLYGSLDRRANIETGISRLLKAILDFLPFILASHLFGALWYFFAVDRELDCWEKHLCNHEDPGLCVPDGINYFFYCNKSTDENYKLINVTLLKESCPINPADARMFDFGIYLYALQSNMTRSDYLPRKMLQCFWWSLRNLSSFGSNLQTSYFADEIIFSVMISISGLTLFLIYFNSRVQVSQKISDQVKLRRKMQMIYPDIDLLLSKHEVSNKDMIKTAIMKNIQRKFEENEDVDVHNFLSNLPIIQKRSIMCLLRLASLKKVPMLESKDEKVLKAICEYLKPVTYSEDIYIIREGEPLRKMFFITQGIALTYTTTNGGTNVSACLEKSDFYGEELLNWAFKFAFFSELPVSTRTLITETKFEAFVIRANHLKSVVAKFWWHFRREIPHSQLEHFAASSLQAAWKRHHANLRARLAGVE